MEARASPRSARTRSSASTPPTTAWPAASSPPSRPPASPAPAGHRPGRRARRCAADRRGRAVHERLQAVRRRRPTPPPRWPSPLAKGEKLDSIANDTVDSPTTKGVPSVLVPVVSLTKDNIKDTVIKDGVYTVDEICTAEVQGRLRHARPQVGRRSPPVRELAWIPHGLRPRSLVRRPAPPSSPASSGRGAGQERFRPPARSAPPRLLFCTTSPPVRRRRRWFTCPLRPCWRCAGSPSDSVPSRRSPT